MPKRPQTIVLGNLDRALFLHLSSFPKPGRDSPTQSFSWGPGGSAFNTAAALVQLKIPTGIIGRVGRDTEGRALLREISGIGISTRHVQKDPDESTGICVIPVTPDGVQTLIRARGANTSLDKERVLDAVQAVRHLHVSGHALSESGSRMAALEALHTARSNGATTSLDFSHRAAVNASEAIREALAHVTVALTSAAELRIALGIRQLSRAAEAAHELGTEQVVARLGVGGCRVFAAQGGLRVPPCEVRIVDTSGADDAFNAGYIFGLLKNATPEVCSAIANAAGAAAAAHPYEALSRNGLVHLLREGDNRARRKKHVEAIRKAIELLSKRGQTKRKKVGPSKSKKPNA